MLKASLYVCAHTWLVFLSFLLSVCVGGIFCSDLDRQQMLVVHSVSSVLRSTQKNWSAPKMLFYLPESKWSTTSCQLCAPECWIQVPRFQASFVYRLAKSGCAFALICYWCPHFFRHFLTFLFFRRFYYDWNYCIRILYWTHWVLCYTLPPLFATSYLSINSLIASRPICQASILWMMLLNPCWCSRQSCCCCYYYSCWKLLYDYFFLFLSLSPFPFNGNVIFGQSNRNVPYISNINGKEIV